MGARDPECESCGSDNVRLDGSGRSVCGDCGCVMPWSDTIFGGATFVESEHCVAAPPPKHVDGRIMSQIREMHPACESTASEIVGKIESLVKGATTRTVDRVTLAVVYIAYQLNGEKFTMRTLASQGRVPEDRMRREVRRISEFIGVDLDGVSDDGLEEFGRELLLIARPGVVLGGRVGIKNVVAWCKSRFTEALVAGDHEFLNCAPSKQAQGVLTVYLERFPGSFVAGFAIPVANSVSKRCAVVVRDRLRSV